MHIEMISAEFELVCLGVAVLAVSTFILKQDPRRNLLVFLLACVTGFTAQLPLGRELNLYTPNIRLYISYVSLAAIVTWGIGFMAVCSAYLWAARQLRIRSSAVLFFLCTLPIIIVTEFIGSNVLHMKLHDYHDYPPLMPVFNSMQAPAWLYGYYAIIQFLFYLLLKTLGMESEGLEGPVSRAAQGEAPLRALEKCD